MMDYNRKKIGSYKSLKVYQKSECVYDITYYFVTHFLNRANDRTVDQMQQAAHSCKQNIVEGIKEQRLKARLEYRKSHPS